MVLFCSNAPDTNSSVLKEWVQECEKLMEI